MKFVRLLILAPFFVACFAQATQPKYPIVLSRFPKVGDVYNYHYTVEESRTRITTIPGQPADKPVEDKVKADIQCQVEIKDVFSDGYAKVLILTIKSFKNTLTEKEEVPAAQIITVTRSTEGDSTYELQDDKTLLEDVRKILDIVFPKHILSPSDDEIFGSKTPRAVGETWSMDVAKSMPPTMNVAPENVTSQVKLIAVEKTGDSEALRIRASETIKDAGPADPKSSFVVDSALDKIEFSGLFPMDPKLPPLQITTTFDSHIIGSVNAGHLEVDIQYHYVLSLSIEPVTPKK